MKNSSPLAVKAQLFARYCEITGMPHSQGGFDHWLLTCWANNRLAGDYNLTLSKFGFQILSDVCHEKFYEIDMSDVVMPMSRLLLILPKIFLCPHYITQETAWVTDSRVVVELQLFGGNFEKYLNFRQKNA